MSSAAGRNSRNWGRRILRGARSALWLLCPPTTVLKGLFKAQDVLSLLIAERATAYGGGVNPKHRLTNYHGFFVERIRPGTCVLDLGCGIGAVARSIASQVPGVSVVGMDVDPVILAQARALPTPKNLEFVQGDATRGFPDGPWDSVVLSNVLEHIELRVAFLSTVVQKAKPRQILIRVPLFERHWHLPLRKELGLDYRSDPTHFIEHSLSEFADEITAAGLLIREKVTMWGEIWAVVEPVP